MYSCTKPPTDRYSSTRVRRARDVARPDSGTESEARVVGELQRVRLVVVETRFAAEHGPAAAEDNTMRTVLDVQFFQCVGERRAVSWYARRGALY